MFQPGRTIFNQRNPGHDTRNLVSVARSSKDDLSNPVANGKVKSANIRPVNLKSGPFQLTEGGQVSQSDLEASVSSLFLKVFEMLKN